MGSGMYTLKPTPLLDDPLRTNLNCLVNSLAYLSGERMRPQTRSAILVLRVACHWLKSLWQALETQCFAALEELACDPFAHRVAPPLFAEALTRCRANAPTWNRPLQAELRFFELDRCYFP